MVGLAAAVFVEQASTPALFESPNSAAPDDDHASRAKSLKPPMNQSASGSWKPILRWSSWPGGSHGSTAFRSTYLPVLPRSLRSVGTVSAKSTNRCDRNGTRASSEWAMLERSSRWHIEAGMWTVRSPIMNCSRSESGWRPSGGK